jgi:hypothetical protein
MKIQYQMNMIDNQTNNTADELAPSMIGDDDY